MPLRKLTILSTTAAAALLAAIAAFVLSASGGDRDVHLVGVPSEELNQSGIDLLKPSNSEAQVVPAQTAVDAALSRQPGAVVRETVLLELRQDQSGFSLSTLVWAVNLDPASVQAEQPGGSLGGEICPSTGHPEYAVVFIDAHSAKLVFDMQKTLLPPLAKDGDCPAVVPSDKDYPAPTQMPGFEATAP